MPVEHTLPALPCDLPTPRVQRRPLSQRGPDLELPVVCVFGGRTASTDTLESARSPSPIGDELFDTRKWSTFDPKKFYRFAQPQQCRLVISDAVREDETVDHLRTQLSTVTDQVLAQDATPPWRKTCDLAYVLPQTCIPRKTRRWELEDTDSTLTLVVGRERRRITSVSDLFFNEWHRMARHKWLLKSSLAADMFDQFYSLLQSGTIRLANPMEGDETGVLFDCPLPAGRWTEVPGCRLVHQPVERWWCGVVHARGFNTGPAWVSPALFLPAGVYFEAGLRPWLVHSIYYCGRGADPDYVGDDDRRLLRLELGSIGISSDCYVYATDLMASDEPIIVLDTTTMAAREAIEVGPHVVGVTAGAGLAVSVAGPTHLMLPAARGDTVFLTDAQIRATPFDTQEAVRLYVSGIRDWSDAGLPERLGDVTLDRVLQEGRLAKISWADVNTPINGCSLSHDCPRQRSKVPEDTIP